MFVRSLEFPDRDAIADSESAIGSPRLKLLITNRVLDSIHLWIRAKRPKCVFAGDTLHFESKSAQTRHSCRNSTREFALGKRIFTWILIGVGDTDNRLGVVAPIFDYKLVVSRATKAVLCNEFIPPERVEFRARA